MAVYFPRLTLELVVAEPKAKILKVVIKWEGFACDPEGEGYATAKGYVYNWSRNSHRLLFKHWVPADKTLRFVLLKSFGLYMNSEGLMRFVIAIPGKWYMEGLAWLWSDFFEVTVCYED